MAPVDSARAAPRPRSAAWRWLAPALLVVALGLAYANTFRSPFLFDDVGAVLNNPTIRRLDSFAIFQPPADGSTTTGRPIVNFSFALNYAVSGEAPWSYHALNLAIHAAAALTLFGLLRRTQSEPLAFAAAALWALHPLLTESVTCIAQRTESLCGLFYLLTLYAFARATEEADGHVPVPAFRRRLWLVASIAASALGMATKEVMVTVPLVVFLYDRTFVTGTFSAAWRARRAYFAALAATWLVLLALLFLGSGARGASAGFGLGVTPWTYLLKQAEALVLYLRLALWPHPLVLDYGTTVVHSLAAVWWQGALILTLLFATVAAVYARRPAFRALGFAGACFFLILSPSSSFVPLVTQTIAEHRMYLPLAAVVAVFVVSLARLLGAHAVPVLLALALVALGGTYARNRTYRDAVTIWADNVDRLPANPRAHHNLALALHHAGRSAEAHPHFSRAVALDPAYVTAHFNWAVALLSESREAEALPLLAATVRLAPDHLDARRHLARLAEASGRISEAETHFNAILRYAPDDLAAHRKLGLIDARAERLAPAAAHFRAVLRLAPDDADTHANLGNVLLLSGQPRAAIACYETSLRLRPADPRTRENLRIAREALR